MKINYLRRSIFKFLKQNKWVIYWLEWLKWHKEIEYHKLTNDSQNLKSPDVIKQEIKLIKDYWKHSTLYYYRYGLQYKRLSEEQLLDYVPTYYFHKNIEHHHEEIDTIKYGDKLVQAQLFEQKNIPTATTIAILHRNNCYDVMCQNIIPNMWDVIVENLNDDANKLFFKPTGNCGGAGILVLKRIEKHYLLNNKIVKSWQDILLSLDKRSDYIIQNKIIQSTQLDTINSSSVNTIRVVVQKDDNKMVVKTCILRMGRQGKEVDNSSQGGISIMIDCNTGRLGEYATAEHGSGMFYSHPDSGYIFKDKYIDNWLFVKTKIESIANKLIEFNDIALDIAITRNDVILVEFNFRYGIEHQQCVLGGMRRILNIPNN